MDNQYQSLFHEHTTVEVEVQTSRQYCDGECQAVTLHVVTDSGLDEMYTCKECGAIHFVRVR